MRIIAALFLGVFVSCSMIACGGKASCDKEKAMAELETCQKKAGADPKAGIACVEEIQKKYSHCK